MTALGPATYDGKSTEQLEFKRFDELVEWLWGEEALDPSIDFMLIPTGAAISTQIHLKSLRGIEKFGNLKGLHLGEVKLPNLNGIEALQNLESLSIHGNNFRKVDPLGTIPSLRYLDMAMAAVSDLSPLQDLPDLQWLLLDQIPVKDLSTLIPCSRLRVLRLNFCTKIRDISPLGDLPLRHLDLNLCDLSKADFGPFESLRYLRPNSHKKVQQAALDQLGPDVVTTTTQEGLLSDIILDQGWVEPGEEGSLPACSMGLHNQDVIGGGSLEPYRGLRELRVPFLAGDLRGLSSLRSVESGYAKSLSLPSCARFGVTQGVEAPVNLWMNRGKPEHYSPELFPKLKWWITGREMWRLS